MELRKLYQLHDTLNDARLEITMLRAQVGRLAPAAEAYEALLKVLGLVGSRPEAMSRDITYDLDRVVENLSLEIHAAAEAESKAAQDEINPAEEIPDGSSDADKPAKRKPSPSDGIEKF